jgi:hypothetical protein
LFKLHRSGGSGWKRERTLARGLPRKRVQLSLSHDPFHACKLARSHNGDLLEAEGAEGGVATTDVVLLKRVHAASIG